MIRCLFITLIVATLSMMVVDRSFSQGQGNQPEWIPELTEDWTPVEDSVSTSALGESPSDAIVLFDGTDLSAWTGVADEQDEAAGKLKTERLR